MMTKFVRLLNPGRYIAGLLHKYYKIRPIPTYYLVQLEVVTL